LHADDSSDWISPQLTDRDRNRGKGNRQRQSAQSEVNFEQASTGTARDEAGDRRENHASAVAGSSKILWIASAAGDNREINR
jgi:hypothetical protein